MIRDDLYTRCLQVHAKAMDLLVRQVRLRRAAERKVSVLKEQLDVKKEVLNNTAQELDALQASIIFARDGKS